MSQLYALDSHHNTLPAEKAQPQKTYLCPECKGPVRVKRGSSIRDHFFHLRKSRGCYQSNKSQTHLMVQLELQRLFGKDKALMEHPFPSIGRIADVCLPEENIVFEVQISPMLREEAADRTFSYQKEGFTVIWILHEDEFRKERVKKAGLFFEKVPHYFTDFNSEGKGGIYDIGEMFHKGRRVDLTEKIPVNLSKIKREKHQGPRFPACLKERLDHWPLYFEGDLLDLAINAPQSHAIQNLFSREKEQMRGWYARLKEGRRFLQERFEEFLDGLVESHFR